MKRRLALLPIIALVLGIVCLWTTSPAKAGTYQVQSCNDGNHGGSNVWSYFSNNGNFFNWGDSCSGAGLVQSWSGTSDAPQGAAAGRYLDAPGGTYFSYLFWQQALTGQGGGYRCVYATDGGGNLIGSSNCIGNTFSEQTTGWVNQAGGLGSGRIYLYTACFGGPCNGGSVNKLIGQFGYANANITDQTSPGLYDLGGVWGRGWVRGSWPLSWNASDTLGMKSHAFQVDGATQSSYGFCSIGSFAAGYYYGSSMQPCPNPGQGGYQSASFSVNTAAYSDGAHSLTALSYDATDNGGSAGTTLYSDNSAPTAPAFSGGPSGNQWTSDTTPTYTLVSSDPASGIGGYNCQVDGGSFYSCSSPTTLAPLSDGPHQFCAQSYNNALDTSGTPAYSSVSCVNFRVDTSIPAAALDPLPSYISPKFNSLSGTASDPQSGIAEVQFQAKPQSGGDWQTLCTSASPNNPYSCNVDTSALTDGATYSFRLAAKSGAGVTGYSALQTAVVDTSGPSAPSITSGPADGSWINTTSATYAFSSSDPVSGVDFYQCRQESGAFYTCASPNTFSNLSLAMDSLSFRAVDNAGNVGTTTPRTVGADTVPPVLTLDPLPDYVSGTVNVQGTATDSLSGVNSSSIKLQARQLPGGSYADICAPVQSGSDYSCAWDTSGLSGQWAIRMTGQDNVGNQPSSWPTDTTTVDNAAPTITLLDSGRVNQWQVLDAVSGIDPTLFSAQFQVDGQSGWQAMEDGYWDSATDSYKAAIPDSTVGGTDVRVRLSAASNAGVETTDTSSVFAIPLAPPVNTVRPVISGSARVGLQVTSNDGTWTGLSPVDYTYSFLRCDSAGEDCVLVPNPGSSCTHTSSTSCSYTLVNQDADHTIRSLVEAANPDGEANAESSNASALVEANAPTPAGLPVVTGTEQDGQTLSVSNGSWGGTPPFDFSFAWQRCDAGGGSCSPLSGAVNSTYKLLSADVGGRLFARVTASNASLPGGGSASQDSSQTGIIQALPPSGAGLPTISGEFYNSQQLTASNGSWQGSTPLSYSYQWQSCNSSGSSCSNIGGANAQTFTPTSGQIGNTLRVAVTASNASLPGGGSASQTSDASPVIAQADPQNTSLPALSGTEQEGSQLTVSSGGWTGAPPIGFTYQWQLCDSGGANCQDIQGATAAAYVLESDDVGGRVQVRVTASNSAGSSSVTSPQSGVIAVLPDPPSNTSLPSLSGTAKVGQVLSASPGSWSGHQPISFAYQWQRCAGGSCQSIAGETGSSYTLQQADASKQLRVQVTASNAYGQDSAESPLSASIVSLLPVNDQAPWISGSPEVGDRMSANPGSWNADPAPSFTYEWLRCTASCSVVATGLSYTPTDEDQGSYLVLRVTASNAYGTAISESARYGPVVPAPQPPVEVKPPSISGALQVGYTMSGSPGEWKASSTPFYHYQWLRCANADRSSCFNIVGATAADYTPVSEDLGKRLRLVVAAVTDAGTSEASSQASSVIQPPACVLSARIAGGSVKAGSAKVSFSGAKLGFKGGKTPLAVKASGKKKVQIGWSLNGKSVSRKKAKSSTLKLTNRAILVGKSQLVLSVKNGSKSARLTRTVSTSPCPPAKKLSPKPATKKGKIGSSRYSASISEIYKSLSPGRFKVSGPKAKYAWYIDNKRVSARSSVSIRPQLLLSGKRNISVKVKRGSKTLSLTWPVTVSDYPN